jgi:DNA-binding MarR family transcriptional regulator
MIHLKAQEILSKFAIGRNEIIASSFADKIGISRQGLRNILNLLVKHGYIRYRREPSYQTGTIKVMTVVKRLK